MEPVFTQLDRLQEDDKFLQRTQGGWSPILGYQRDQPLLYLVPSLPTGQGRHDEALASTSTIS
jgi:hypothetical protein